MLIFKKYQDKIQLMIPLSLFIALIISFFTLSGTFTICDTNGVQFTQKPKEANLQTHSEKNTFFKQDNCDLQNYSYHSSQIMRNSIQNQELQKVGCQRTFWIWDFTTLTHYEINATILAIGKYSYIFMENSCISGLGESVAIVQSETIRDEFDNTTYPRVTDLAGHPNGTLGDIDGDPRIVILLSDNEMSYYSQRNEQSSEYSNEC